MLLRIESASADWFDAWHPGGIEANRKLPGNEPAKGLKELVAVVGELELATSFRGAQSLSVAFELMSRLGARATACLEDLWRECIAPRSDVSPDHLSATAARLCFVLVDAFAICVGRLEDVENGSRDVPPAAFCESAMRIARWCARWSWLRYELPPAHLWLSADSFHRFAERRTAGGGDAAGSHLVTVERDYLTMLLLDWLHPNSLSLAALSLLDGTFDKCLDGVRLEQGGGGKAAALLLNPASCRFEFHSDEAGSQPGGWSCSVSAEEVLARLETHLRQLGEGPAQREALHVVAMRRLGGRGSCGKRRDPRVGAVRSVYLSYRFGGVAALVRTGGVRALCNGMQGAKEAIVLDVSQCGCRIALPAGTAAEVGIGCLLAMMCPQKGEITLGIARWIERGGADSLEIGVEILRGSVSAFPAVGAAARLSAEYAARPVLVLEAAGEGHRETFLPVLVAKDFLAADEDIRLLNSAVVLQKVSLVESGPDFDLYLCRTGGRA